MEHWLTKTPPITTIRVNLLKSSVDAVKERVKGAFISKYGSDKNLTFVQDTSLPELLGIAPLPAPLPPNEDAQCTRGLIKEVVVDPNCGRSVLRGSHIFAPGVLGMSKRCAEGDLCKVYVDLEGKFKKGGHDFQPADKDKKLFIGIGRILQPRYKLFGDSLTPSGNAVDMQSTLYPFVPSIGDSYLSEGIGILQNLPSMVAVRALDPAPGETILDMCSAPGHKTQHIIELMEDTGTVIALEKIKKKVVQLQKTVDELQFKSIKCFAFDSSKCVEEGGTPSRPITEGPPFSPASFDRVLLDAPCSGLGNRPQLPWSNKTTVKMLQSYPVLQKQLFFAAVAALRPRGSLVFSTCTINQHENELMVAWALQKFPQLQLVAIDSHFGSPGWPTAGLTADQLQMVRRFGPPNTASREFSLHNSIGFFVAKFVKQ